MPVERPSAETERKLAEFIGQFVFDPYGFVMATWPWGKYGTPLEKKDGPEPWQKALLIRLGEHCRENAIRKDIGLDYDVWRSAVASGHGVGKSAMVAWIIYWIMSTRANARGIVTANTGDQLENKTWPELAKWHDLAIHKHWFNWTSTSFYFAAYPEDKRKNYMFSAVTVSPERTEAFAGLHNEQSAVVIIKDEASAIDPKVWEVATGALTDGEPFDFNFGNPTRADGEFYEAFNKNARQYAFLKHVDSRHVSHTNKRALQDIIDKYGPESDAAKVRVYGQFPVQSYDGFISPAKVDEAVGAEVHGETGAGLIMAIDPARFGDDSSVIAFRQGRDARSIQWEEYNGLDNVKLAEKAAMAIRKYRPEAVAVENVGMAGAGVIDVLRSWGFRVHEVNPGVREPAESTFNNRRTKMWHEMRDWIYRGAAIPDNPRLYEELTKIQYGIDKESGKTRMEPKADFKTRLGRSPDYADALMLTFDVKVPYRSSSVSARTNRTTDAIVQDDPFAA